MAIKHVDVEVTFDPSMMSSKRFKFGPWNARTPGSKYVYNGVSFFDALSKLIEMYEIDAEEQETGKHYTD
jgi:hypothetical protein